MAYKVITKEGSFYISVKNYSELICLGLFFFEDLW